MSATGRPEWKYQPGQGPHYFDRVVPRTVSSRTTQAPLPAVVAAESAPSARYYHPSTQPANAPVATAAPAPAADLRAKTQSTIDFGVQGSSYHYHESSLAVKTQGAQFGVTAAITGVFGNQWFGRLDTRIVGGPVHYKGSGESDHDPNVIGEFRATGGRDFLWGRFGVAPYAGLGYRYLRNDARGTTSSGASGYRRESNYFFIPVGLQNKMVFSDGSRLTLTTEFDPLIYGRQKSRLSDIGNDLYPDLTNRQKGGYGLHGDLMYKRNSWSFGPFVNYWNINQSDTSCSDGDGTTFFYICGFEPHNHTVEYGFNLRYSFH
ncbi:MAG TPA: hypothetical protein DCY07_09055 [Rhodospirillaceae bacterium]|nr:hypothetical protein [Rhodospirillaceae bacterium]